MSSYAKPHYTPREYLEIDRRSELKHEYFNGEVFAMTGASRKHNLITSNLNASLNTQLKGGECEVYASDMRVKVSSTGLYTYSDIVVVCESPVFEDSEIDTLINPNLIIEVLSKSTEGYDRGKKFGHYRRLNSLMEYILISQDRCNVEHYVRQPDDQWLLSEATDLSSTIELPSIKGRLALADVYDKVELKS